MLTSNQMATVHLKTTSNPLQAVGFICVLTGSVEGQLVILVMCSHHTRLLWIAKIAAVKRLLGENL